MNTMLIASSRAAASRTRSMAELVSSTERTAIPQERRCASSRRRAERSVSTISACVLRSASVTVPARRLSPGVPSKLPRTDTRVPLPGADSGDANIMRCTVSLIPGPVSVMLIVTSALPSRGWQSTSTVTEPDCVYCSALLSRFMTSCVTHQGSKANTDRQFGLI